MRRAFFVSVLFHRVLMIATGKVVNAWKAARDALPGRHEADHQTNMGTIMSREFLGPLASVPRAIRIAMLAAGMATLAVSNVHAQENREQQVVTREYNVPAGPLGTALLAFGQQAGIQFTVDITVTKGKRTAGIRGSMNAEQALGALLGGTGLTYRFTGPRTVEIETLPVTGDTRMLGPVRIEGAESGRALAGINGSSDATATENSGSYTPEATALVSKTATALKDTPQSVSVMTRQRLDDQNLTDFRSVMEQLPGITVRQGANNLSNDFYSRGFEVRTYRVDGGAPASTAYFYQPNFDMAMYDHVELLRGSDGMYSGYGEPGGIVNLVRKRPLDHNQALLDLQVGSWNDRRVSLDVTGPIPSLDGVRGRLVAVHQEQDFFYDVADVDNSMVYGVLETNVTDELVLRGGFQIANRDATPWQAGLPRYQTGPSLPLSRETCLCFDDSYEELKTQELFLAGEYQFAPSWQLKLNLMTQKQKQRIWYGEGSGALNPNTNRGWRMYGWYGAEREPYNHGVDLLVSGEFSLFGIPQKLAVGANYQETQVESLTFVANTTGLQAYDGFVPGYPAGDPANYEADILNFDRNAYLRQPLGAQKRDYYDQGFNTHTAYANWSGEFFGRLHLNLGLRYSYYKYNETSRGFCSSFRDSMCNLFGDLPDGTFGVIARVPIGAPTGDFYKRINNADETFSLPPTWSLVYDLADNWTAYGSYADIYRSQANNLDVNHNPLPPVTGFTAEFGTRYVGRDGRLNASLAGYYTVQEDMAALLYNDIEFNESMRWNVSCCYYVGEEQKATSYGLDAEVTGEIWTGVQIAAGYTLNRNKFEWNTPDFQSREPLRTYAPEHHLKLWASWDVRRQFPRLDGLRVGAGVNYQSASYNSGSVCTQYVVSGVDPLTNQPVVDCDNFAPFAFTQGGYAVSSAMASYRLDNTWTLSLNVNNLFDKTYFVRTGSVDNDNWYGEPRSFSLGLRGKF